MYYGTNLATSNAYFNLYCQKTALVNGNANYADMVKVIPTTKIANIAQAPITTITEFNIPESNSPEDSAITKKTTSTRKVLTEAEKKIVKDYVTAVYNDTTLTAQQRAQKIYNRMLEVGLDTEHIADAISVSLADTEAYLNQRNTPTSTSAKNATTSASASSTTTSAVTIPTPTVSLDKTTANAGETVTVNWNANGTPSYCQMYINGQADTNARFSEGKSSGSFPYTNVAAGTHSAYIECNYNGYAKFSSPATVTVKTVSTAVTSPSTTTTATSARKVLTEAEKTVVKNFVTDTLNGSATDKEKAQKIYNAMTTNGLDPQHIADSTGYSLADVNAFLAKR